MKYLKKWIKDQKKKNKIFIKRKNLNLLKNWIISEKEIYHKTRNFFQVIGIRVNTNLYKKTWDQPIMVQNENGILGILKKKINNEYKYLLQTKLEPGNINQLQISPTVQATESNYRRVHGGKKTQFLEFFLKKKFIVKSKQSEQGLRYLNKFNTNYLLEIKTNLNLPKNFRWFSKPELNYLIKQNNLLHMDTISVFSCAIKKGNNESLIYSNEQLKRWFKKQNNKFKISHKKIDISDIKNWKVKKNSISNLNKRHFSIIGLNIKTNCREVKNWDQPIIAGKKGFAGFVIKNFKGTTHYLCRFVLKPGLKGGNISCTTNFSDINDFRNNDNISSSEKKIIKFFFKKKKYLYDTTHSDEGGRFYKTQVRRVIIKTNNEIDKKLDSKFIWVSHNQFLNLIKNRMVDIEARLLFACYNFNKTL